MTRYVLPAGLCVAVVRVGADGHLERIKHSLRAEMVLGEPAVSNRGRLGFVVRRDGREFTVWANEAEVLEE